MLVASVGTFQNRDCTGIGNDDLAFTVAIDIGDHGPTEVDR